MDINVYCDESCHLPNDGQKVMGLGLVWVRKDKRYEICQEIKKIKAANDINTFAELKWSKISPSKYRLYEQLVSYFFKNKYLHFRGLIVPDKTLLNHENYNQTHDDWYYKMYFHLIKVILNPKNKYNIYIDFKDTRGEKKRDKLHEVLSNNAFDFSRMIIGKIQGIHSHEVEIMQLTDILLGAVVYANRKEFVSGTKTNVVKLIQNKSNYALTKNTLLWENKFNLLIWESRNYDC